MKKSVSIKFFVCSIVGLLLLNSCEKTSKIYVFSITNSMSLNKSDAVDVMDYVESRMDFEAIQVTVYDNNEAEGIAEATQIFETRLQAIDDDELNEKLKGDDYYSLHLIMSGDSYTEIASKKWPTD